MTEEETQESAAKTDDNALLDFDLHKLKRVREVEEAEESVTLFSSIRSLPRLPLFLSDWWEGSSRALFCGGGAVENGEEDEED